MSLANKEPAPNIAQPKCREAKSRGGRPSREDSPRRLEHLLDIATENFVRLGYSATTLDRIAAEAGVAKRTIYARYPDKQALFFAVVRRLTERQVFEQLPVVEDLPLAEGLRTLAHIMIDRSLLPDQLISTRMILAELNHFPDLGQALWRAVEEEHGRKLIQYFRHQREKGAIRNLRPSFLADLFMNNVFSFINHVAILRQNIPSGTQVEEYIDDLVDLLVSGMRA